MTKIVAPLENDAISIASDGWREIAAETVFARCLSAFRANCGFHQEPVDLLLTDNDEVRELNARYRGKDRPTNVLSFPAGEQVHPGYKPLGDIAIAFETVKKESHEKGISLEAHTSHLIVHGLLHLIGMDHDQEKEAEEMEDMEVRILDHIGVANPYRGGE